MKTRATALLLFLPALALGSDPAYHARYVEDANGTRTLLESAWSHANAKNLLGGIVETRIPRALSEGAVSDTAPVAAKQTVIEIWGKDEASVRSELRARGVQGSAVVLAATGDEVRVIAEHGPAQNRISLVFNGDGYTAAEKDKFFADVARIAGEIFTSATHRSYVPLFNVYAVFRASEETGVGIDSPKKTAFQAFRMGNTLRGIDASPAGRLAVWGACHEAPGCDYPILIVNDSKYGGLGGEIAISTASVESSYKVLAHELGHTIGIVGEEYDGGGYFGANFSADVSSLTWSNWLSEAAHEEPSQSRVVEWPWQPLLGNPYEIKFTSDGKAASALMRISGSGLPTPDSLSILIDGQPIPQPFPGWPDGDRQFYDFSFASGFAPGDHTLRIVANHPDATTYLSSVVLHEFGAGYHTEPGYIGAYPLFSEHNVKVGVRPTHETCLMRNINSHAYCPICLQNLWLKLFRRISLIDSLEVVQLDGLWKATVHTPALGQFRAQTLDHPEYLKIRWWVDGQEQSFLEDSSSWVEGIEIDHTVEVEVSLQTSEVRSDPQELLIARKSWQVR